MKKRVAFKFIALLCFSFILSLFLISAIYAESVENTESTKTIDSEILKLTNYAEEYESGNINYVQLAVYL